MFISDLKNDFYNVLRGKRVLVIVNYDIDAICASKILQALFRYDHMVYSIVPIMGVAGLQRTFSENKDDVKNVVLINCGVCLDIVELLQPDEDVTFFICDSHRPMDVCNVYSDSQVRERNRMTGWPATDLLFLIHRFASWANQAATTAFRPSMNCIATTMPKEKTKTRRLRATAARTRKTAAPGTGRTASSGR